MIIRINECVIVMKLFFSEKYTPMMKYFGADRKFT